MTKEELLKGVDAIEKRVINAFDSRIPAIFTKKEGIKYAQTCIQTLHDAQALRLAIEEAHRCEQKTTRRRRRGRWDCACVDAYAQSKGIWLIMMHREDKNGQGHSTYH